ncbi:hypothetical protein QMA02_19705 [Bacillus wiedmannii]|uniref:hypothetical protein n=1 Tax=Bacillus wiedmannii TaxID=1890302 RepID=UPI0024AD06C8|nr:hypothetical protein [Bacillus wiedmannii]MDI6678066.1 hypothetical protein [Bacillus wiedmannii]
MYCVGFIPFNFVLASVKVPVYRTNDNGTLERVGTNVEGWVHGHCIDSNQKIQDEIDSVRASLAEIRGSGGTKGTGESGIPPRCGERKITDEEYEALRKKHRQQK